MVKAVSYPPSAYGYFPNRSIYFYATWIFFRKGIYSSFCNSFVFRYNNISFYRYSFLAKQFCRCFCCIILVFYNPVAGILIHTAIQVLIEHNLMLFQIIQCSIISSTILAHGLGKNVSMARKKNSTNTPCSAGCAWGVF